MSIKYSGIAIVLAWPETFCKQAGAWYDLPMRWLGFNVDYFYQAGHAAVILVNKKTGEPRYFDFGRYHAPYNHGRVRSSETDTELTVLTKAEVEGGRVANIDDILAELQKNKSYHGDGTLYSSQMPIDYDKALAKALDLQSRHFLPYGPFVYGGTNCSRFVSTVIQAGSPPLKNLIPLKFFVPLTPTTLTNITAGAYRLAMPKLNANGKKIEVPRPNYRDWAKGLGWLKETFPAPERHPDVPTNAQWLSGEGYGSWYEVSVNNEFLELNEYGPQGKHESKAFFKIDADFQPEQPFEITYPSNCKVLTIKQHGETIQMTPLDNLSEENVDISRRKVV
ncbi:MAG: DUF6695 family protein [Bacteroidales bacterium]